MKKYTLSHMIHGTRKVLLAALLILAAIPAMAQKNTATADVEPAVHDETASGENSIPGIRAILLAEDSRIGECSVWTFDSGSLAMEVNQAAYSQKLDRVTSSAYNPRIFFAISGQEYSIVNILEKKPMYFDKEGYVYTQNGKRWVKTPFVLVKAMTRKLPGLAEGMFSFIGLPAEQSDYYGIDVQPDKYPILEWAFKYKVYHFEAVEELEKEFVNIYGDVCFKYTAASGKDKGSFVLFDHLGRLLEIYTINSGRILYTYGDYTVKLPEAQLVGQF